MSLIKTSIYSGISTFISLVVKLITNKVTAVYLGTSGMFLLGQLKDFINIADISSNLGSTKGVVKYIAEYKDRPKKYKQFIASAFKIQLISSTIVCVITIVFKDQISNYFFEDIKFSGALVVFGFSFITYTIHNFFMSVFNGLKDIKIYVIINIIISILTAAVVIYFVIEYNIIGAFYAIAINQIIALFISLSFIASIKPFRFKDLVPSIKKEHFKNLTKFSFMTLSGPLCMVSATLFIRFFLADEFDDNHAGSWEGMWRLSNMYILFLTTTFQFYLIPTFSNISGNDLKQEIFKVWKLSIPIIVIITCGVYVLKDFIITFIFSKEFLLINSIILFHLLGDAIKINAWVLGNVLISKAKTTVFIAFQIGWAVTFCVFTFILVKQYGFVGVSMAYFATYILHFLIMNIYFRKLLWINSKT
ncbi:hypothetical protein A9Q87_13640 [Flavobacteriales bacterium 34_180_T64]|nr:hypothetical protein A9Q87_13640 [Flavobacteriales bacterium 34_180_T64]